MDPERLFNDISQFVADSRDLLKRGEVLELAGLDGRVMALCEEVVQLSDADRQVYSERLQQLFDELDKLGNELAQQRDAVGDAIRSLPQHKKASVAYRVVNASGPKNDE